MRARWLTFVIRVDIVGVGYQWLLVGHLCFTGVYERVGTRLLCDDEDFLSLWDSSARVVRLSCLVTAFWSPCVQNNQI